MLSSMTTGVHIVAAVLSGVGQHAIARWPPRFACLLCMASTEVPLFAVPISHRAASARACRPRAAAVMTSSAAAALRRCCCARAAGSRRRSTSRRQACVCVRAVAAIGAGQALHSVPATFVLRAAQQAGAYARKCMQPTRTACALPMPPQAAQKLVHLHEPLPPSPVIYPECSGSGGNSTCLRVLFLTRSPKPAVRQVWLWLGGCCRIRCARMHSLSQLDCQAAPHEVGRFCLLKPPVLQHQAIGNPLLRATPPSC